MIFRSCNKLCHAVLPRDVTNRPGSSVDKSGVERICPGAGQLPSSRDARGFTLIEIAVVLLLIAIIAAIVVPQVIHYMRLYRIGVASQNVSTAIQRARYLATSNNTRAGIVIHSDHQKIDILVYDAEGVQPPQTQGIVTLPSDIVVSHESPKDVAFDGRGVVTPLPFQSPVFEIDGVNGLLETVTVSPTGQVTMSGITQRR